MLLKLHALLLLLLLLFTTTTSSSSTTTTTTTTKSKKQITASIPISSGRLLLHSSTYILPTSLGSPPQPLLLSLSTTSSSSLIPCSSSFSPSSSSTFLPLLCNSSSCPLLSTSSCLSPSSPCSSFSQDTLSFSSPSLTFPNFTFSCITTTSTSPPSQPLLSLSLSPSSFISQTNSIFSSTFSYCLPFFLSTNFSGSLLLGPSSQPKHLKTMPLLTNPRRPFLYYVNFTGIRLGHKLIHLHYPFDPSSGAGTVLDPGSMYTRLSAPDYAAVRDTFRKYVKGTVTSLGGFDTCYDGPVNPPAVTLVFDRLQMKLPPENVMIHSSSGSLSCLAMYGAAENDTSGLTVIGSMQHQNHRVLFDVPNRRVGIAREICTVS